jgi:hypothetical protein
MVLLMSEYGLDHGDDERKKRGEQWIFEMARTALTAIPICCKNKSHWNLKI